LNAAAASEVKVPRLAVLPFEIHDNSGDPRSLDGHEAMLTSLTRVVRDGLEESGLYDTISEQQVDHAVATADLGTYLRSCSVCDLKIARGLQADQVMVGWVFKMSALVLSLHLRLRDAATGRVLYARVFDFRGDNETAWQRAGGYAVSAILRSGGASRSDSALE
jgi:hypothetical protein